LTNVGLGIASKTSGMPMANAGAGALEGIQVSDKEKQGEATQALARQQAAATNTFRQAQLTLEQARNEQGAQNQQAEQQYRRDALAQQERLRQDALVPPDVRAAQVWATLTPAQKSAYGDIENLKKGMLALSPDIYAPAGAPGTPQPGGAPPSTSGPPPAAGSTPATTGQPNTPQQQQPPSVLNPGAATRANVDNDFLSRLPPQVAAQVKAYDEGRAAFPPRMTEQSQQMLSLVTRYDPTFDTTDYNKRNKTAVGFGPDGQEGRAITAANTVMGHMGELQSKFDAIGNSSFPLWNETKNWFNQRVLGGAEPGSATEARDAVASELRKVFAGAGGGSLQELDDWKKNFPISGSPQQMKEYLGEAIHLMDSRLDALGSSYQEGMGTNHQGIQILHQRAQDTYERLMGQKPMASTTQPPVYGGGGQGGARQQPFQAPVNQQQTPANRPSLSSIFGNP
jgi:hypothetical protein